MILMFFSSHCFILVLRFFIVVYPVFDLISINKTPRNNWSAILNLISYHVALCCCIINTSLHILLPPPFIVIRMWPSWLTGRKESIIYLYTFLISSFVSLRYAYSFNNELSAQNMFRFVSPCYDLRGWLGFKIQLSIYLFIHPSNLCIYLYV